jgi:branched-chain amino acid transport system substrate-binding protein
MRKQRPQSRILKSLLIYLFSGLFAGSGFAFAEVDRGVLDSEILFGQCAALTGPIKDLGTGVRDGLQAAFEEANAAGGVYGRHLRLISADDGYEPDQTVDCTARMLESRGVFALAGFVGTPTSAVAAPIAQELKVPLVGLFTGTALVREPVQRYIVNIRASYDNETESLVEYLTAKLGVSRIGVFYQNDSFGRSGINGIQKALARRNLGLVCKGSFERNTLAIKSGLAHIMAGAPDAIIMVAPYEPAAEFVREARKAGVRARFATISFVGTERLITDLGSAADGIIISQVVPPPTDQNLATARDYRASLSRAMPNSSPSYAGFEGYIAGRVLTAALRSVGRDLTREKLIDALNSMNRIDIGGMIFSFSELNHQGSNSVFLTRAQSGKAQPIQ